MEIISREILRLDRVVKTFLDFTRPVELHPAEGPLDSFAKLTGTADGPGGQPLQIKDGKVEGEKISFSISLEGGDGEMRVVHEGSINGDEMTLNIKMDGGPGGGPGGPIKLKRTK